eukprot:tig00020713_g13403.t1
MATPQRGPMAPSFPTTPSSFAADGSPMLKGGAIRRMLYQVWPSKNKFFCGGRIMSGPELHALCYTFLWLTIPSVIYFVFLCPHLYAHVSSFFFWGPFLLYIATMILFFGTACSDPGIIPRQSLRQYCSPVIDQETAAVNGTLGKYCKTCNIYRPPRSKHCRIGADRKGLETLCVADVPNRVANCVGRRNYRIFLVFVASVLALCLTVATSTSIYVLRLARGDVPVDFVNHKPTQFVIGTALVLFTFLNLWFPFGVLGFHAFLVWTNQTTNEMLKGEYRIKQNPYSKGHINNCIYLLCSTAPPSAISWRKELPASELPMV